MGVPAPLGVGASGRSPYAHDQANGVVQGTIAAVGPSKPFAIYGSMNMVLWASYNSALTTTAGSLTASVASASTIAAGEAINATNVPAGTTVGAITGTTITLAPPTITLYGKIVNGIARITDLASTTWLAGATVSGLGITGGTTVSAIATTAIAPNSDGPGRKGIVTLSAVTTAGMQNDNPVPFEFKLAAGAITTTGADAAAIFTGQDMVFSATMLLERSFDGGKTWVVCSIAAAGTLAKWSTGTPVSISFSEPERGVLYRINTSIYSAGTINYRISATGQAASSVSVPALA